MLRSVYLLCFFMLCMTSVYEVEKRVIKDLHKKTTFVLCFWQKQLSPFYVNIKLRVDYFFGYRIIFFVIVLECVRKKICWLLTWPLWLKTLCTIFFKDKSINKVWKKKRKNVVDEDYWVKVNNDVLLLNTFFR